MVQTKQRQLIMETVRATTSHPTADDLYQVIRQKMPKISLATVYRNLNFLAKQGEIRKLSMPDMPDRFDWRLTPHDHMVCAHCGKVLDFALPRDLKKEIARACDTEVQSYALVAKGVCSQCRMEQEA